MSESFVGEDIASTLRTTEAVMDAERLLSAGQMLRQARVNAGMHVAVLAITLKVPVKRIEALENDDMALLPDVVFVRALALSICRTLKVDSGPILDRLPKASSPVLNGSEGAINRPIRMATPAARFHVFELFNAPWAMGVLLLLVGAASIYLWPQSLPTAGLAASVTASRPSVSTDIALSQDGNTSRKILPSVTHAVIDKSVVTEAVVAKEQSSVPESADKSSFRANIMNTANMVVPPSSIVVFKATGQTWVEVKSVSGITILKKLLNEGEIAGATGALPLTVIVGRADVTQVEVRGKQVDLFAIAKSNVARFEVN